MTNQATVPSINIGDEYLYTSPELNKDAKFVPLALTTTELAQPIGALYFAFIQACRDLGVASFKIPAGSPGLSLIMQSVVSYMRGIIERYNLTEPQQ